MSHMPPGCRFIGCEAGSQLLKSPIKQTWLARGARQKKFTGLTIFLAEYRCTEEPGLAEDGRFVLSGAHFISKVPLNQEGRVHSFSCVVRLCRSQATESSANLAAAHDSPTFLGDPINPMPSPAHVFHVPASGQALQHPEGPFDREDRTLWKRNHAVEVCGFYDLFFQRS